MRVAILTSSRADYGIYRPLLKKLQEDSFFDLKIIAFGTHLSRFHGYTVDVIEQDGFVVDEKIESLILGDTPEAISNAIGNTIVKFSSLWNRLQNQVDLVFALGDRYEMFAAVSASVPFNIRIAHIHGGETTLGAIDNKFRHAISLMADLHFVSTVQYKERVISLVGSEAKAYHVGALSLDNLKSFSLLTKQAFKDRFKIDLSKPTILSTFHPETVSLEMNEEYVLTLVDTFNELSSQFQIVITMPNADTMGSVIRKHFLELSQDNSNVICVENFGILGYFSCMQHCSLLLGNTSSGIIEAASFEKYVINIGDRQKGRMCSLNTINVAVDKVKIKEAIGEIEKNNFSYKGKNVYATPNLSSEEIRDVLKIADE